MLANCTGCNLCTNRFNMVKPIGNPNASIVFIADYPRFREDKTGIGFTSKIYKPFMEALSKVGINETNAYFTHILKCRPRINEIEDYKYLELEFHICSGLNLNYEIGKNIKYVVPIGRFSTQYVLGQPIVLKDVVNKDFNFGNKIVHPIQHPLTEIEHKDILNMAYSYKRNVNMFHKIPTL